MNKIFNKIPVVMLVLTVCMSTVNADASIKPGATASPVDRLSTAIKHKTIQEKTPPIAPEALEIKTYIEKAIIALNNQPPENASSILRAVSSKLEAIKTKNPDLALLPVRVDVKVLDFDGSSAEIKQTINRVENLLKQNRLQDARRFMAVMASEIRVDTLSIPLDSFAAEVKQVLPLIESGKIDQAAADLNQALDTLVVSTEVIPLPLLRAEELLTVAAQLEHKDDLTKEMNREQIEQFTDAAKNQLELAQLLGYGDKDNYKALYKEIDSIRKVLFSEKSAAAWQTMKDTFADLKYELKDLYQTEVHSGLTRK